MTEQTGVPTSQPIGVGLHVCRSIERDDSGNLLGVDCDQNSYENLETLWACVVGRPPTIRREIKFYLNDSIVEKAEDQVSSNIIYSYPLDSRFIGEFRLVYAESGCDFWARSFRMGTCPTAVREEIPLKKLVDLLHKFRT